MELKSAILSVAGRGLLGLLLAAGSISCSTIFTDQTDCPRGVSLRFVYDHNMEYVNSFHTQAHCATVYVFDEEGRFVTRHEETGDHLRDESWRMTFDLEPGNYKLIAYSGLACEGSSFTPTEMMPSKASGSHMSELAVTLDHDSFVSDEALHDLYYGNHGEPLSLTVLPDDYVEETVNLIKNTNNIRIVLQQMNGEQITADEFEFSITDDNTHMNVDNNIVSKGQITYLPWTKGETVVGVAEDGNTPVTAAFAEFSTSRLTTETSPRLAVFSKERNEDIINIPLNTYLLLLKSQLYDKMSAQEYLDRESMWTIAFFLDSGNRWINTHIIVNDWTIRINDSEF